MKKETMKTRYYAAYGSNLNLLQMEDRCPKAKRVGTSSLEGYQLLFKGVNHHCHLTVEPKEGSFVPLGIFEVNEKDEASLDNYEGCPFYYHKEEIHLRLDDGKEIDAFIYIMNEDEQWQKGFPNNFYYHGVRYGYQFFGFDILARAYQECTGRYPEYVMITELIDGHLMSRPVYDMRIEYDVEKLMEAKYGKPKKE